MKFYKYLSLAVLFALTLAAGGCSQEDNFPDANGNMVINVYDAGMKIILLYLKQEIVSDFLP